MLIGTDVKMIADTHTHTLACDHAFSTIHENARAAREKGIEFLCSTEHGPTLPGAPTEIYFGGMPSIMPDVIDGVTILKGAEVNIIDYEGRLDLSDSCLSKMDWVIASFHTPTIDPATPRLHTQAMIGALENPHVDVVGHLGDGRYVCDYEEIVKAVKRLGKIIEINAHSFRARKGSPENCREIARLCKKHAVNIVVSSDAHVHSDVGRFDEALDALREVAFPLELILNADRARFLAVVRARSARQFN